MKRAIAVTAFCLVLLALFLPGSAPTTSAKPRLPDLPPLPPQAVIDAVVAETGGAAYIPTNAPLDLLDDVFSFVGGLTGSVLDTSQAVHYISANGTLLESVIPITNLAGIPLAPLTVAPGLPTKLGMVIGVLYQQTRGTMWVVVTFNTLTLQPDGLRFYRSLTQYYSEPLKLGTFSDADGNSQPALIDAGAAISNQRTCITVGLKQVCWKPFSTAAVRAQTAANNKINGAINKFKNMYNVGVEFDAANAVPDLLGKSLREGCAAHLATATHFDKMAVCKPNAFITAAEDSAPGKPIAVMVLTKDADIRTYNSSGQYVGQLPKGKYLVLSTPVANEVPGTPTALFLVGANGSNYLIPSMVTEGLAAGSQPETYAAGIRDGFASYRCFGW